MKVFSWNLNKQPVLLEAALRHLATAGPAIASLQEVPVVLTHAYLLGLGLERDLKVLGVLSTRWRSIALVASSSVNQIGPARPDQDKMVAATVSAFGMPQVDVVAVHAISRWTAVQGLDRQKYARVLRRSLNSLWRAPEIVVAGDFNAEPFHAEMWDDDHIYALRDRALVQHHWAQASKTLTAGALAPAGLPLYNPGWRLLVEELDAETPAGTFRYPEQQYSHWLPLDYLLVSPRLGAKLTELRVVRKLGAIDLCRAGQVHSTVSTGDHLPIEATFRT